MNNDILNFNVQIYGDLVPYDKTKSIARCRIFYKYGNRNGTYITDEFAEKLISSLPYTPIKGIYKEDDFTDHGKARTEGRIYGVVPEQNRFAWEPHVDEDGIERIYACSDVLLYTALYGEAAEIINKSQSMELYKKSVKGEWKKIDGKEMYVFEDGCFLGLQALGDEVIPAFEGASFYSLKEAFKTLLEDVHEYDLKIKQKGENEMFNFNVEDNRYSSLWSASNPSYTEEANWTVTNNLYEIGDNWILTNPIGSPNFTKIPFEVTENEDGTTSYSFGEGTNLEVLTLTAKEKAAILAFKAANGDSYENFEENFVKKEDFEQKTLELEGTISTLQTEKETSLNEYAALKAQYDDLQTKYTAAAAKISEIEDSRKTELINKYSAKLDEETLKVYRDNLSTYTYIDLNKDLAYELVKAEEDSIFSEASVETPIPKEGRPLSNIEAALSKHLK